MLTPIYYPISSYVFLILYLLVCFSFQRGEKDPDKDFKKLKSEDDIALVIRRFTENKKDIQVRIAHEFN